MMVFIDKEVNRIKASKISIFPLKKLIESIINSHSHCKLVKIIMKINEWIFICFLYEKNWQIHMMQRYTIKALIVNVFIYQFID